MYLKRKIDSTLSKWKKDPYHKPLLMRGARQVGKTTAVRHLAKSFESFVEVNLEVDGEIRNFIEQSFDVQGFIALLEIRYAKLIVPGKTLLFLDEIQSCPRAVTFLRYLYENIQPLHVIAAGSLLEFAIAEVIDIPVGRVRNIFVYPFSFTEFVSALGGDLILEHAKKAVRGSVQSESAHEKLLEYLKTFLIVGGMPAAVLKYVETKSFLAARDEQRDIMQNLKEDFAKYKTRVDPSVLRSTLQSVINQTGQQFTFSNSELELTYAKSKKCTDLMERAKIIMRIDCTRANGIPLGGDINAKDNKFMFFDTGLYLYETGLNLSEWINDPPEKFVNRGKLAEMFVAHELKKAGTPLDDNALYYWHRDNKNSNAEVDFVVQYKNAPLPIEVKSGVKGAMKSLRILMNEKSFSLGVRASEENFGAIDDGRIQIVPMYFIGEYETVL
jgi:predicted AAA+ superfamily ATPase